MTVLLTTQYLDEADQLADDIVVVDHGKVIATGRRTSSRPRPAAQTLAVRPRRSDLPTVVSVVGELAQVTPEVDGQLVTAPVTDPAVLPAVVRRLDDAGVVLAELALRSSSLERGLPVPDRPSRRPRTTDGSSEGARHDRRAATAPTAPALSPQVSPVEGLRQTLTLAWRTLVQIRHNPWELGDFSIQPIMFVLLFTYVFGGAIAGSTGEYLTFALPGIIVMNMLFVTMYVGIGLNTDLTKGVFDRLRSLPIARWAPLAGRSWPTWSSRPGRSSCCSRSG